MTPRTRRQESRGATMIEMVMVGIPMIFMLICIFEISRGMWVYTTEAFAAKEGVRYAIVHGVDCQPTAYNTNNCASKIGDVAWIVWQAGVGLDPATTQLIFTSADGTVTTCFLSACLSKTDWWPPQTLLGNAVGSTLRIDISTPFRSALGMFWPGSSPVPFSPVSFGASSTDYIQF
jgi:hypothetical protein